MGKMVDPAELARRAIDLRNTPTPFEKILWKHLSRSQLGGYKFRRQHVIGPFITDFFCPAKALVEEIDGNTHTPERDQQRDHFLTSRRCAVLHFTNRDVGANLDGVLQTILLKLEILPDRWPELPPNPTPPLKERGAR